MKTCGLGKMRYSGRKAVRISIYGIAVTAAITLLVGILNLLFLLVGAFAARQMGAEYAYGGRVMESLTRTENGYMLSGEMERALEEQNQWAMLLDGEGKEIWSFHKPEEVKDSYTRSDIARMTRWYLQGYPVQLRVWDDRIMVVGMQRDVTWKYNIEFSISWINFIKKVWIYFFLLNFAWVVVLAFFFTGRFLKTREQARIEWIAGVSHDIRTPLSMVMGYADILERDKTLSGEARQQASIIRHQSMIMKELIADLNLTSQLEYSMEALRKEKVRPAETVRSVTASFLNDAPEGTLEIELEISEEAEQMTILADRRLLIRAFQNLINNSMKHSGQSGQAKIHIFLWREGQKCCIRFEDEGIGYSQEILKSLKSRKRNAASQEIRGLGIVKKVVLAHGGKICFGNSVKSTSSRSCRRVFRGEVLSFTPKNAKNRRFSCRFESQPSCDMAVSVTGGSYCIMAFRGEQAVSYVITGNK